MCENQGDGYLSRDDWLTFVSGRGVDKLGDFRWEDNTLAEVVEEWLERESLANELLKTIYS